MAYTVKQVAELTGVSIRALHHYDAIGLLKPAQVSDAGYRLYSKEDLQRLQQILFFRELDFRLQDIAEILDDATFERRQALLDQKRMLLERRQRLGQLIETIDRTVQSMERGQAMKDQDMFEGFDPSKYEEEAQERWGHTPEWAESQRRTRKYTKDDWVAIKKEASEISLGIASRMDRGPSDPEVLAWVAKFHEHINQRFYRCSIQILRGLADGYVDDERFAANWEKVKPGMAQFMRSAVHAYCDSVEKR